MWFVTISTYFGLYSYHFQQRQHWVPYFDDGTPLTLQPCTICTNCFHSVQAIIFLAPLAFNQVLEEDPRVNRLVHITPTKVSCIPYSSIPYKQEDSIYLWKEICSNTLLSRSTLILFLNKVRSVGLPKDL